MSSFSKRNWGDSRMGKSEREKKEKCDPERDGEGGGGAGTSSEKGALLPLSCVSWPAVKSRSLPVSTGSPQGAIVQDSEGKTGTEV